MKSYETLIDELALLCNIVPEFWDNFGQRHFTPLGTKQAILREMGFNTDSAQQLSESINALISEQWTRIIEPVHVFSEKQPLSFEARIPLAEGLERDLNLTWAIDGEDGGHYEETIGGDRLQVSEIKTIGEMRYVRATVRDAAERGIGYYSLAVTCSHPRKIFPGQTDTFTENASVIIAPERCYMPQALELGRAWGLSVNLYSLRSSEDWGIGDFGDLKEVLQALSRLKGGFVGINPLHATPNRMDSGISPYSPLSRMYKNFIYLELNSIPDVEGSNAAQGIIRSARWKRFLSDVTEGGLIDYDRVGQMKKEILQAAFRTFLDEHYRKNTSRASEFHKFLQQEGAVLESYARFAAVWDHMHESSSITSWQDWPPEFRDRGSETVREFIASHGEQILFHKYLQWLIDAQHREAADVARRSSMPIGIYHDLAIGAISGGAHAWSDPELIALSADIGAPPDEFSLKGQNWGIRPFLPRKMRETAFRLFTETIRKNMRHNGALRIDHALGLFRLFWIPQGMSPLEGAYVEYPHGDLLRIIALESVRNRTVVIAEDLGTVGEDVRAELRKFGILSYRVLYFERNYPDPSFTPPERYPAAALCTVTTHDLPTLSGYWEGRDIEMKKKFALFKDEGQAGKYSLDRERDKKILLAALKEAGVLPPDFPSEPSEVPAMTEELCNAIYSYLARTPCTLVAVSLDDVIGTLDQQNLPAAPEPYPNWRRKTAPTIKEIFESEGISRLAELLNETIGMKDRQ